MIAVVKSFDWTVLLVPLVFGVSYGAYWIVLFVTCSSALACSERAVWIYLFVKFEVLAMSKCKRLVF